WTPFHLHAWRDIVTRVHGHRAPFLAARDGAGALTGVLPLVLLRHPVFGRYLVSMPFVNYGGPLGTDDAVRALAAEAARLADRERVKLMELRSRTELPLDLPASHRKVTVVLDLPDGGPAALMKGFEAKLRSQVRRPAKDGITVRFGRDQVEPFYGVFARHMRDLGTPVQPKALFAALADAFGDDLWVGCAWMGDVAVAGGVGFRWGTEFEMTWASSLHAYNRHSPNMGLYWAFMERACLEGLTLFNFGRCTPGAGTHRFKRQWGSRDEQLWWYQHGAGAAATPSPDDGAYAWGPRLWKRLPLPVANLLGPPIVAGIP
ncbi:MAG TPA: FemAB family XrtA/PEP-CTERM system-associated protein, partial [Gemmatimonadales bacterium]|nr:FemAB family XrtA/PEP-CTERM system-associated protein [Gemmatimonadales bacterium]